MYIRRWVASSLRHLLKNFRIISLIGPRQAGKTTLIQNELPKTFRYFDLERPSDYDFVSRDIEFFLENIENVIFDEAQRLPELFPALRSHSDQFPKKRFILLGSASPHLLKKISESLRGRLAIIELSPFLVWELRHRTAPMKQWIRGGFPPLYQNKSTTFPLKWYEAYLKTYLEQDLPSLGFRLPAVRLRRLLEMLSHLHGNILNVSELGASLGINYQTVQTYMDIFENSFLVRHLRPYYANIGKRLVKTSKIYIRDSGLLHYLLGVGGDEKRVLAHPKAGFSWEGFVIEQILTLAHIEDPSSEGFFWKTSGGAEVDLLLKYHGKLIPIEIKFGKQIPHIKGMNQCLSDLQLKRGYIFYFGNEERHLSKSITLTPIDKLWEKGLKIF